MSRDPIVEEVHRVRRAYAARFHFDLDAMARDMMERQERGEFRVVYGVSRRPRTTLKRPSRAGVRRSA